MSCDDDHLDPPHLHLGHTAFCLKGVKVGGQGEHHVALSHTNLNISMVIVLRLIMMTTSNHWIPMMNMRILMMTFDDDDDDV